MKKHETLKFDWPDVGELEIKVKNNYSATLRFSPSKRAIAEMLKKIAKTSHSEVSCLKEKQIPTTKKMAENRDFERSSDSEGENKDEG